MIQIAPDIDSTDYRKVPLPVNPRYKRLLIEVAADREVDIAIVGEKLLKEFEESETGDDVPIDWYQYIRSQDLEFEFPSGNGKQYLLLWNANAEDEATIAYKISPIPSAP